MLKLLRIIAIPSLLVFSILMKDTKASCNVTKSTVAVDVVIVGAGLSGLVAYAVLKRLAPKLKVVVIEASGRYGGRVKKGSLAGSTVELGAGWLHNKGTPLRKITRYAKLKTTPSRYMDIAMFNESGDSIQHTFDDRMKQFTKKGNPFYRMLQAANAYWEGTSTRYDGSEAVLDIMKNDLNYNEESELDVYIRWWAMDYEDTVSDVALNTYSGPDEDIPTPKEEDSLVSDPRGLQTVIDRFVAKRGIASSIVHNSRVTHITYDSSTEIDATYKAIVQAVEDDSSKCTKYKAKRVIVSVPVAVLRGEGHSINFSPPISLENLPYHAGQYNKVLYKFNRNFWRNITDSEFIGILREEKYRYICNHWHSLDKHIPGSAILSCTLTDEAMKKFKNLNLTPDDLLDPLRIVFGRSVVDNAYVDVLMARWDLDPFAGNAAFSAFRGGYKVAQHYLFYGGFDDRNQLVKGEGYNSEGQWIVHFSGAASCFEYYEQLDGAYFAGQRSARYLLRSLGSAYKNIKRVNACEP